MMTNPSRSGTSHARWTSLAVVAPVTAAAFAGATVWAADHNPKATAQTVSATSAVTPAPVDVATADPSTDIQAAIDRLHRRADRITAQAADLRQQAQAVAHAGPTSSGSTSTGSTSTGSTSSGSSGSSGGSSGSGQPAPAPAPAPPPPPADANTGASGG